MHMTAVMPRRSSSTPEVAPLSAYCQWCGATAAGADLVAWSFSRERGRDSHACPSCVRDHLYEIETHCFA